MTKQLLLILAGLSFTINSFSQLYVNEASNANVTQIADEDNQFKDWIEIYNAGSAPVNLSGYGLSDDSTETLKWKFPAVQILPDSFVMVFASGKDKNTLIDHYETAVFPETPWKYIEPGANISGWTGLLFNDNSWSSGKCSVGNGDGDDSTVVTTGALSVYLRKTFVISDVTAIANALLHIDYDDGFVAYLNGVEIARNGLNGTPPDWDVLAGDHEAQMYGGGLPERFIIDPVLLQSVISNGLNVLAIELHNTSPNSSDLTVIPYLSFGINNPTNYFGGQVPSWFQEFTGYVIHTNFSLANGGEGIYFSNPSGTILHFLTLPNLDPDMSYGLFPDGASNPVYFADFTPGSTNNASQYFIGYEAKPVITPSGGFYSSAVTVTITNSSTTGGQVYYSLDGEEPTINDIPYTGPFSVSQSKPVRARCFPVSATIMPSQTATETYFVMDDFTLPIISLTTDSVHLYGNNGIYDNYFTDWKKPCHFEYFDENGVKILASNASVKIDGGAGGSRSNPQRSFTVEPDNKLYGDGVVNYPFIQDKAFIDKFGAFYLRNGSNMWNVYPQKEACMERIIRESHTGYTAYTPVIVYLNGDYFGVYEFREKTDELYFENNYGNNPDSLDLLSVSYFYGAGVIRTLEGSDTSFYNMYDFITTGNPASPTFYEQSDKVLDLKNYTDYLSIENWYGNVDWLYNNMKMARNRTTDNRWRFYIQDVELGLGEWTSWQDNMFDYFATQQQPNPYWDIYSALIQNTQFHDYFINRYADLMNTTFKHDYYYPVALQMHNQLLPEMPRQFARWTDTLATPVAQSMQTFNNYLPYMIDQFDNRCPKVREQMVSHFQLIDTVVVTLNVQPPGAGYIKISTIIPDNLPWQGVYFHGVPVTITAIPNPGYSFFKWEQNGIIQPSDIGKASITYDIAYDTLFKAIFSGSSIPLQLSVSEAMYNCDSSLNSGNWVELHNYSNQNLDISDWQVQTKTFYNKFTFPTGTIIPPNDYIVLCEDTVRFKLRHPGVNNFTGELLFGLSNSWDSVKVYDKTHNLVKFAMYADSLPYPKCADGWGRTLEHTDDLAGYTGADWFCGCMEGSPGVAFSDCNDPLIVSEINYNNSLPLVDAGDWIELKNNTSAPINLAGYVLKDSKDQNFFTLPGISIPAGGYWVLYQDAARFDAQHPGIQNKSGPFVYGYGAGGDVIRVFNNSGTLQFSMLYDDDTPWSIKPDTGNYTLQYIDTLSYLNPNSAASWIPGCPGGSPGSEYIPCFGVSVEEGADGLDFRVYPNPSQGGLWIEWENPGELNDLSVEVRDITGKTIRTILTLENVPAAFRKEFQLQDLASGVYYLKFQTEKGVFYQPFVKE